MLYDAYVAPEDGYAGSWVGRVWLPGSQGGPAVVVIRSDGVYDVSRHVATISALLDLEDPPVFLRTLPLGESLGTVEALLRNSDPEAQDAGPLAFMATSETREIGVRGVTFAASLLERV